MPAYKLQVPLQTLQKPIENALIKLQQDFEAYLAAPDDVAPLQDLIAGADEAHGAFLMLEQPQAASLMRETGLLAQRLLDGKISAVEQAHQLLSDALLQAPHYFEWLQRSGDKPHFDLLALLEPLRNFRTSQRIAINVQPSSEQMSTPPVLRQQLQQALLQLLNGDYTSLAAAESAFAALSSNAGNRLEQRIWALSAGACRVSRKQFKDLSEHTAKSAIERASKRKKVDNKRSILQQLLRDLDRLLRDQILHRFDQQQAATLCHRLEDFLSQTEQGQQEIEQTQNLVQRHKLSAPLDRKALISVAKLVRKELALNEAQIDQFSRDPGAPQLLEHETERLAQMANVLSMLELPIPEQLLRKQIQILQHWQNGTAEKLSAQLFAIQLFECASDLAAVHSCLDSFSDASYSRELATAAKAILNEHDARILLQRLELHRAHRLIALESERAVDRIWLFAIDFMDSLQTSELEFPDWSEVLPVFTNIYALFVILDRPRATTIAEQLYGLVNAMAEIKRPRLQKALISCSAQVLVALESYLGLLENQYEPEQTILEQAEQYLDKLTSLAADMGHLNTKSNTESTALNLIAEAGMDHNISKSAIDDTTESQAVPQDNTQGMEPDDEIIEIYLEEVQEEIARIAEQLPLWRENPGQWEALKTIRRSFHTLKGSSRMVGEAALGEFAWSYEQILNEILDGRLTPTPEIADAIAASLIVLREDTATKRQQLGTTPVFIELAQHVEALRSGKPSELPISIEADQTKPAQTEPVQINEPTQIKPVPAEPAQIETSLPEQIDPGGLAEPGLNEPDQELIEALIEEGAEILDASDTTLQQWHNELDNISYINNLRRGMHTLKGGAGLAGQKPIADLAHAMESILEAVSRAEIESTQVLEPLQQTLDRLSAMFGQISDHQTVAPADSLIEELNNLLQQDTLVRTEAEEATQAALLNTFVQETLALLEASDLTLRRWNQDSENSELLADLMRDLRTLRDNARLAGFSPMGELAGVLSEMLQAVAKGQITISNELFDLCQQALDGLGRQLDQARAQQPLLRAENIINEFNAMIGRTQITIKPKPASKPSTANLRKSFASAAGSSIRVDTTLLSQLTNQIGESSIFRARVEQGVSAFRFNLGELRQTVTRLRQQLRRLEIETEAQILFRHEEGKEHGRDFDPLELDRFSELQQVSRSLLEIVDDLTSVQNTLEDQTQSISHLLYQQSQVNQVVQQNMMKTRMVGFSTAVPRLRRVLRQAAQELGKQVELELAGDETEVDRTLLESMVPALEHMLRNAAAHGIETPAQRQAVGKPGTGRVMLTLRREGAEQVVELRDDGAGLNFDVIHAKAISKGLLEPGQEAREQELINFLLEPGFSTAEQVSQISGRGVGLDVLNEAIIAMRGALQIQSRPGQGTTFTVRLPFSLEVTQALLVQAGEDTFAVPLLSIEAVDRLKPEELTTYLAGEAVDHHYGEHAYPVHNIGVLFGSEPPPLDEIEDHKPPLLLFRSAEASAALQIDAILGKEEIIIKPVSPQLDAVPGVSGATVLGDGRVAIVLDAAALVRNIDILNEASTFVPRVRPKEEERLRALVIDDSITMRKITTRLLERHNAEVNSAKDGVEAIAALEDHPPELIILDIEMPRMDGFEVLAHIRNQPQTQNVPVIMVTSRSGEKHRGRAMRLGVDAYLIKPYQDDELLDTVNKVLAARNISMQLK